MYMYKAVCIDQTRIYIAHCIQTTYYTIRCACMSLSCPIPAAHYVIVRSHLLRKGHPIDGAQEEGPCDMGNSRRTTRAVHSESYVAIEDYFIGRRIHSLIPSFIHVFIHSSIVSREQCQYQNIITDSVQVW